MYLPPLFTEHNPAILKDFIKTHPLGTLISLHDGTPQADLLPFYLLETDETLTLIAHFAKANPLVDYIDSTEVMILFYGEQGYITPNWYPSKHIHHRHVPTWNYEVVEVRGRATCFNDHKSLMRAVGTLTNICEQNQPTPWAMKDAPRDYLQEELQGILGLSICVQQMVGKFKLSQNREPKDLDGVVKGLMDADEPALAKAVAQAYLKKEH